MEVDDDDSYRYQPYRRLQDDSEDSDYFELSNILKFELQRGGEDSALAE